MSIDSMKRQILAFDKSGEFQEMEKLCRKLLKKKPRHFDVLQLLGLALHKQGKQQEAIAFLKKALTKNASSAAVHNNLGYAYVENGNYQDALTSLRKSIRLDSSQASAFNNLGIALFRIGKIEEAITAYEQAIKLDSQYHKAIDNLGGCLQQKGLLHEAIQEYLKANEINPLSTNEYVHLVQALAMSHITDDALYVAEAGLKVAITESIERLELLINFALICWLSGKLDQAKHAIIQSEFATLPAFNNSPNIHSLRAFRGYLDKLIQIRPVCPEIYEVEAEQAIFFVGDSHCLSPSETVIQYQGQFFRVLSTLIKGCKAWHLGRSESNQYKKSIELLFKALPAGSKIVVGMGEIDCRADEGILPAFLKKGLDYHTTIPGLVESYVQFTTILAKQYGHSLIFYGVPALNQQLHAGLDPEKATFLAEIIQIFNEELLLACQKTAREVLDVYGATKNKNNIFHMDQHHLHPKTLGVLFESHLLS